jgi:hypothetical protein
MLLVQWVGGVKGGRLRQSNIVWGPMRCRWETEMGRKARRIGVLMMVLLRCRDVKYAMRRPVFIVVSGLTRVGGLCGPFMGGLVVMVVFMVLSRGGRTMCYE